MAKKKNKRSKVVSKPKARRAAKPAAKKTQPIPKGYHTITPNLVLNDASAALEFYARAFGAKVVSRMASPSGKIMHAELRIGDSMITLADEMPGADTRAPASVGTSTVGLMVYLKDVDKVFAKAERAGCKVLMPLADQFWGDRFGRLQDPFGHVWALAKHVEDVSAKEMAKRQAAWVAEMASRPQAA